VPRACHIAAVSRLSFGGMSWSVWRFAASFTSEFVATSLYFKVESQSQICDVVIKPQWKTQWVGWSGDQTMEMCNIQPRSYHVSTRTTCFAIRQSGLDLWCFHLWSVPRGNSWVEGGGCAMR